MSHSSIKASLACLLVICILGVGGLASAQSIAHESQHTHHQKATHSSVLCSWMCAAGQTHDASFFSFEHQLTVQHFTTPAHFYSYQEVTTSLRSTRAPPSLA